MKDVVFLRKNKVVRLKERVLKIELSAKKIKESFRNHRTRFILVGVFALFVVGAGYFLLSGKADVAYFYPNNCLGGWENPQNAQGQPEVEPDAQAESFNANNSAVLRNAVAQIFCGGFQAEAPTDSQPVRVVLKLSWLIKNPMPEENPIATSTDVLIPEFPLASPEPTSTEAIISSTSELTPTLEASSTPEEISEATPIPTIEITSTPTPLTTIEIIPETTLTPTPEITPEISPTPLSFWGKIFSSALAQEISVTPTPEVTPEPTPEPTPAPTIELTPTPTPEPTITPTLPIPSEQSSDTESSILDLSAPSGDGGQIGTEPTATLQESEIVTPTPEPTEEATPEPPATFLQISYTLDGSNWNQLAKINSDNWQNLEMEIPITNWDDLANLQISIQTLPTVDSLPDIYLDGLWLEVEYNINNPDTIIEETAAPESNLISSESPIINPLTTRNINKNISIDVEAKHSCQIEPFQIDVSGKSSLPAQLILQKVGTSLEEIEIGSLPFGVDITFSKNKDYLYRPAQDEAVLDLEITNEVGSQKGNFSIPIIYTKKDKNNSSVICQINVINF